MNNFSITYMQLYRIISIIMQPLLFIERLISFECLLENDASESSPKIEIKN